SRRGETVLRDVTVVAVAVDTLIRLDGCEGSRTCLQNPYVASDEVNILPRTHEGDDLADPVGGCNAVCVDEGEYLPPSDRSAFVSRWPGTRLPLHLKPDILKRCADIRGRGVGSVVDHDDFKLYALCFLSLKRSQAPTKLTWLIQMGYHYTDFGFSLHYFQHPKEYTCTTTR